MYASTRNTQAEALGGADLVLKRLIEYHKRYGKPTFIPYLAVSTYRKGATLAQQADGWDEVQLQVIQRFRDLCPRFVKEAHSFGVVYMTLADDPDHDGYFGQGEYHLGLLGRSFEKKPSLDAWFTPWNCLPERASAHPP